MKNSKFAKMLEDFMVDIVTEFVSRKGTLSDEEIAMLENTSLGLMGMNSIAEAMHEYEKIKKAVEGV